MFMESSRDVIVEIEKGNINERVGIQDRIEELGGKKVGMQNNRN